MLSESKVPISDEMCKLFVDLYKTQPSLDHISANKILKNEGFFKRLQDMMWQYVDKGSHSNNIFAPTATLKLL